MNIKFCVLILFLTCSITLFSYGSDGSANQNNGLYGHHGFHLHAAGPVIQTNIIPLNHNQITQQQRDNILDFFLSDMLNKIKEADKYIDDEKFEEAKKNLVDAQNILDKLSQYQYKNKALKMYKNIIEEKLNFLALAQI